VTELAPRAARAVQPLNLALRFVLELCALAALSYWGWLQTDTWWRYVLMLGLPALAAAAWGTFAVRDDPSRSGGAPVPVPGILRLVLELAFFGLVCWALYDVGAIVSSLSLAVLVAVHYVGSHERVHWLVSQRL
jgi:Protein of unknown function (DUF2568)